MLAWPGVAEPACLQEVLWSAVHGQGVVKVVRGVELSALGRVRQRLVRILDGLELLFNGRLGVLVRRGRTCLVRMVLQGRLPICCGTSELLLEESGMKRAGKPKLVLLSWVTASASVVHKVRSCHTA